MALALVYGTSVYAVLGVFAMLASNYFPAAKSDKGLTNLLIWLTVACCWLMYVAFPYITLPELRQICILLVVSSPLACLCWDHVYTRKE
mmetsp:Transcript_37876/g.85945  ORF Transcript_37876/g.85945 Transcript_37876/m.85945 type:complete len:89 (-) Transcript_37876:370-636(-)